MDSAASVHTLESISLKVWIYQIGKSEAIIRKGQYNDQRSNKEIQAMVDQILHRKLMIEQYNSTKNRDELRFSRMASSSCSTGNTRPGTLVNIR